MVNNNNDNSFSETRNRLIQELEVLRRLILERVVAAGSASTEQDEQALALIRLCRNLTAEEWERMNEDLGLNRWIALPLSKDSHPLLVNFLDRIEERVFGSDLDPVTGFLKKQPFERYFELELQRCKREGTQMSFALVRPDLPEDRFLDDPGLRERLLSELSGIIGETKRGYDTIGLLDDYTVAMVIPGAGPYKTYTKLDMIQKRYTARSFHDLAENDFIPGFAAGIISWKGRITATAQDLITLTDQALFKARASDEERIVTTQPPDLTAYTQSTMVHSDEKRFLFSGTV